MRLLSRWKSAVVAGVALAGVTGCGPSSTVGEPITTTPSAAESRTATPAVPPKPTSVDEIQFDPCSALPASLIASMGVDENTPRPFRTEAGKSTMVGCKWDPLGASPKFGIQIAKNFQAPAVFRANQVYVTNEDTMVNGVPSVQFRSANRGECSIAMPLSTGSAVVKYLNTDFSLYLPDVDSCPQALELARAVEPYLPKA